MVRGLNRISQSVKEAQAEWKQTFEESQRQQQIEQEKRDEMQRQELEQQRQAMLAYTSAPPASQTATPVLPVAAEPPELPDEIPTVTETPAPSLPASPLPAPISISTCSWRDLVPEEHSQCLERMEEEYLVRVVQLRSNSAPQPLPLVRPKCDIGFVTVKTSSSYFPLIGPHPALAYGALASQRHLPWRHAPHVRPPPRPPDVLYLFA